MGKNPEDFVVEDFIELPPKLTAEERKIIKKLDVVETIDEWVDYANAHRIHHETTIEWNAPRTGFAIHPSSLSADCKRSIFYQATSPYVHAPVSTRLQRIFDSGTAIAAQLQYYLETRAKHYGYKHRTEVGFHQETNRNTRAMSFAGTADGVSWGWPLPDRPTVWEYKSINRKGFGGLSKPSKDYVLQVLSYEVSMMAPITYLVYLCKDDSQLKVFPLIFEDLEELWRPMIQDLLSIVDDVRKGEPSERRVTSACKRCKYLERCNPNLIGISTRKSFTLPKPGTI